jgi:hypothetical protein
MKIPSRKRNDRSNNGVDDRAASSVMNYTGITSFSDF